MAQGYQTLTEKEKQTLRLILRGHDAKSLARHLNLSVHTVNERLRDARRKLGVSSSRAAARLVFDAEGSVPENVVDSELGEARNPQVVTLLTPLTKPASRSAWALIGVIVMSAILAILALVAQPQVERIEGAPPAAGSIPSSAAARQALVEQAARTWLAVVDAGNWEASWRDTGASFRKLNTVEVWTKASQQVRVPLGDALSRTLLTHDTMPAPPQGYDVLRFRTDFAGKASAVETLTLEREGSEWKVVGYLID